MANLPVLDVGYEAALSKVCEPKVRCTPSKIQLRQAFRWASGQRIISAKASIICLSLIYTAQMDFSGNLPIFSHRRSLSGGICSISTSEILLPGYLHTQLPSITFGCRKGAVLPEKFPLGYGEETQVNSRSLCWENWLFWGFSEFSAQWNFAGSTAPFRLS